MLKPRSNAAADPAEEAAPGGRQLLHGQRGAELHILIADPPGKDRLLRDAIVYLTKAPPTGIHWLTFAEALDAYTRGAAYAGFAEDRIGSLEPGKWADFILVDRDPTKVDVQALARTEVVETWVAGKKVWARPAASAAERGK